MLPSRAANNRRRRRGGMAQSTRGAATKVTLCMALSTEAEFQAAKSMGAVELGLQTLGKLERCAMSRLDAAA